MVPLDGTDFGRHAVPWAVAIGRATGASVHLVHVHVSPYAAGMADGIVLPPPDLDADGRAAAVAAFDDLAVRLALATGVAFTARVVEGDTVGALLRTAREVAADLIVMTTHAREGIARALLGSVADQVVRRVKRPVLLVRPSRFPAEEHETPAVSEILVLLDGTPQAEAIVQHATALCGAFGAACTLFRVVVPATLMAGITPSDELVDDDALAVETAEAGTSLASLAARHWDESYPVTSTVVRHGDVPVAVLAYCAEHPVGVVAMASHGRRGLQRAVLGSVTDALLRDASVPLLVLVS